MKSGNLLTLEASKVSSIIVISVIELQGLLNDLNKEIDQVILENEKKDKQRQEILKFLKDMKYRENLKSMAKISIKRQSRKPTPPPHSPKPKIEYRERLIIRV